MFSNVALDVFIGLVFVFLLYSLLATIIMEFVAHYLHMRPRLLMKALRRMLEDNQTEVFGIKTRSTFLDFFSDTKESIKRYFHPFSNLPFLKRFYDHPTIKYLGESRSSSKPSYMQASNFSQTIIQMFRGQNSAAGISQMAAIEMYLFKEAEQILADYERYKYWVINDHIIKEHLYKENITIETLLDKLKSFRDNIFRYKRRKLLVDELVKKIEALGSIDAVAEFRENTMAPLLLLVEKRKISADTLKHFQNLFIDAQYNLDHFKLRLEKWFEETMERATGWYKRQTQVILLCLGFTIAIWGNVDTLKLYKILSKDKKAREQMVNMAIQSQGKYAAAVDTIRKQRNRTDTTAPDTVILQPKNLTTGDTILDQTYKALQEDINTASNILGIGWCTSDSCKAYAKKEEEREVLKVEHEAIKNDPAYKDSLSKLEKRLNSLSADIKKGYAKFKNPWNGWSIVGWLITALAISLGAPFWFDMLNKLMRLRSASKTAATDNSSATTSAQNTAPITVNVNPNSGEEAVG